MSWVRPIPPDAAPPALAERYTRLRSESAAGRVSNVWQAMGADPAALDAVRGATRPLLESPAPLTAAQAEMIAVAVSATNGCGYCVAHHGPKLAAHVGEPLARAVARDYREAGLAARDRVMLDAAVALTCEPDERTRDDIERLREYGFADDAIVRLTALAAGFNAVNRVVLALGVELEPGLEPWDFGEPE